jgi:hypothetical protein
MLFVCLFLRLCSPVAGYGLLVPRGFVITHNDAPQSVGFIWTSNQLSQRPLFQHTLHTNIHASGGIRTHDRSRRAAVDLRLKGARTRTSLASESASESLTR